MHADRRKRAEWGVALAAGRKLPPNSQSRWKGRLAGFDGGRPRSYDDEQIAQVRDLRNRDLSLRAIGRIVGISKNQVARILAAEEVSRNPLI